MRYKSNQAYSR